MMKIEDVKVGDRIYSLYRGKINSLYIVKRTTKTMIICDDGSRFRINHNRLNFIGSDWNMYNYTFETPELKEEYNSKKLICKVANFVGSSKLEKLSPSDLEQINQILSKYE